MTAGQVVFPLFVRAKDSGEIASFDSVHELQSQLERIDVENREYEAWDNNGHPIDLKVQEPLWLKVESNSRSDVNGLRRALLDFGHSLRVSFPENLEISGFQEALKQIREAQENRKLARSPIRRFLARFKK